MMAASQKLDPIIKVEREVQIVEEMVKLHIYVIWISDSQKDSHKPFQPFL